MAKNNPSPVTPLRTPASSAAQSAPDPVTPIAVPKKSKAEQQAELASKKDDLLLLLAQRDADIATAEKAVDAVRLRYAELLEPFKGLVISHKGGVYKVAKNAQGGYGLRDIESKDLKAFRQQAEGGKSE